MAISITCPGCQSVYQVPEALTGKTIRCKKCGETVAVSAPAAPLAARPVAARPAARVVAEDDDVAIPARPARPRRDPEEDDEAPRERGKPEKKGSKLPLVLGSVLGVLVLGAAGVGALFATGVIGGDSEPTDVAENIRPPAMPSFTDPDRTGDEEPKKAATTPGANASNNAGPKTPAPRKDGGRPPLVVGPATVTTPPPAPITSTAGIVKGKGPTKDEIDPITLTACKNAAVFIKIEDTKGGGGSGSGWFGLESNLIFTNAHVIGMKSPGSPKPAKLTVWVNPGTPQEKEIPHAKLEILAVDREMDLAVIRVMNETGLPPTMKVRPSSELRDLERLVVLGYPGGERLSEKNRSTKPPAVTIAEARVQNLRKDDNGNLYSVQLQSNIVHGNSGGPIVDADGNVVAVAVRVDLDRQGRFTGIAYGVPTEYVIGLLAGRIADVEYGEAYKKNGKVHIPVTAHCLDPLERLKKNGLGVAAWVGEAESKGARPPGPERTPAQGDLHYAEINLDYKYKKDDPVATGEIVLPELPAGRSYWAQPFYANALVSRYFMAGNKVKLSGPPVDLVPADLIVRYKTGTRRPLTLVNSSSLEEFEEGEGADKSERLLIESELKMTETVQRPSDRDAVASLLLNYEEIKLKAQIGPKTLDDILPKEFRNLLGQGIKRVQGLGHVNKSGEIYKTASDVRGVAQFGPLFRAFSNDALETLAGASITLPNTRAEPNFTWTSTKSYRLLATFADGSDLFGPEPKSPGSGTSRQAPKATSREYKYQQNVTYTYLGSRTRAGVKEAVVKIEGKIVTAPGTSAESGAHGLLKGYAYIDLDTGTVLEAEVEKELEIDTSLNNTKKRISGINKYKLSRGSATTG
jgi:S1-C subfamily serine protease